MARVPARLDTLTKRAEGPRGAVSALRTLAREPEVRQSLTTMGATTLALPGAPTPAPGARIARVAYSGIRRAEAAG